MKFNLYSTMNFSSESCPAISEGSQVFNQPSAFEGQLSENQQLRDVVSSLPLNQIQRAHQQPQPCENPEIYHNFNYLPTVTSTPQPAQQSISRFFSNCARYYLHHFSGQNFTTNHSSSTSNYLTSKLIIRYI